MSKFCVTNQVLVSIIYKKWNSPTLANFVFLQSRSWIEHNLRKRGVIWLCCSTSSFWITNQVLVRNTCGNSNSPTLANFVLLSSRSWNVHNFCKQGVISFPTQRAMFGSQKVLVSIIFGNLSCPISANFLRLRSQSRIIPNLRKGGGF